jgi:hypothetical protein
MVFMLIIDVSILKGNMVMWYSVIDAGAHTVLNYRCRRADYLTIRYSVIDASAQYVHTYDTYLCTYASYL